jgi:hypothetical protein
MRCGQTRKHGVDLERAMLDKAQPTISNAVSGTATSEGLHKYKWLPAIRAPRVLVRLATPTRVCATAH